MKKLLVFSLAVLALVALAATNASAAPTPITFKMFNAELNANADGFQSPVAKEITRLTGVTLDIEYSISDSESEKIALMAASGDVPDLIYAKGSITVLQDAGLVMKLDDLINKYGPNVKKLFGNDIKRLRWSKADPSIYNLGGKEVGQENPIPVNGFLLQHAVVIEQGYPKIKTLADFEKAIQTYVKKHPTIDGQPTIGLSILADDWRALISLTNPACFATGGSDDGEWYIDEKTLTAVRHHTRPIEREYFRWLNHMNALGLLDPESFTQKYDQYKAKIVSGRVVGLADAQWEIDEVQKALRKAGKEDKMFGFYPATLRADIKNAEYKPTGYLGGSWGMAITTKCKDPVRAMQFFDWMCTEQAQILNNWGIEGVHYKYDGNKRVFLPEFDKMRTSDPAFRKKTGIGNYLYPFPNYGNTIKDSKGNFFSTTTIEQTIADQTAVENKVLKAYGVRAWKELYPQAKTFSVKPYGAAWLMNITDPEYRAADQKVVNTGYKMIPAAVLAKPADFDAAWDAYLKAIDDAGLPMVTKMFNEALKDRIEMWK
jgi:putative aldouronate transport system substrate-binding protein